MNTTIPVQPDGLSVRFPQGSDALETPWGTSLASQIESYETVAGTSAKTEGLAPFHSPSPNVEARRQQGWGPRYVPDFTTKAENEYRLSCARLRKAVNNLFPFIEGAVLDDSAAPTFGQILEYLEELYHCAFGEGESLKQIVLAAESQIINARWTPEHVNFLDALAHYLTARAIINEDNVQEVLDIVKESGLDPFRGTTSNSGFQKSYKLIEVED